MQKEYVSTTKMYTTNYYQRKYLHYKIAASDALIDFINIDSFINTRKEDEKIHQHYLLFT